MLESDYLPCWLPWSHHSHLYIFHWIPILTMSNSSSKTLSVLPALPTTLCSCLFPIFVPYPQNLYVMLDLSSTYGNFSVNHLILYFWDLSLISFFFKGVKSFYRTMSPQIVNEIYERYCTISKQKAAQSHFACAIPETLPPYHCFHRKQMQLPVCIWRTRTYTCEELTCLVSDAEGLWCLLTNFTKYGIVSREEIKDTVKCL